MADLAVAHDGQRLGGDVLPAVLTPGAPAARGTVLLLHAMGADRRSYRGDRGLPGVLAAAGFDCLVADFRGRGASAAASFAYDDLVDGDAAALIAAARARGGPVIVVGHSLGAHVAIAAATRGHRADAYVLLAGNVWLPEFDRSRRRRLLRHLSMTAFLTLSQTGAFPARRLRFGPVDEPLPYVRDLVRFWRTGRWTSRAGHDYLAGMGTIDVPVLSITGRGDALMAHHVVARAYAARLPRSEFRVVGRATGLPEDVGHMALVTHPASRPVWDDVAAWLVSHFPSGSPGI